MYRQIVLDTETTGLKVEDNHRIIEIGCVEMVDRKLTGKNIHYYLNPEREIEEGAAAVHGISSDFLKDKPLFATIADELINFISDAEVIIHNAPFDLTFINYELNLTKKNYNAFTDYCSVIDTLPIARQLHVGQRNSLDALCKRYGIDNSKRELHGALLDANLLAQVYLAMTGGQGSFFDSLTENQTTKNKNKTQASEAVKQKYQLFVMEASEQELIEHENYLKKMQENGNCLWLLN